MQSNVTRCLRVLAILKNQAWELYCPILKLLVLIDGLYKKVATEISWRYADDLTHENSKDNFSRETRTFTILKLLRVVHLNFKIGIPISGLSK